MDILIAIGIAVFMLMLYCCVKAEVLKDQITEEFRKEKEEKKIQQKATQKRKE